MSADAFCIHSIQYWSLKGILDFSSILININQTGHLQITAYGTTPEVKLST